MTSSKRYRPRKTATGWHIVSGTKKSGIVVLSFPGVGRLNLKRKVDATNLCYWLNRPSQPSAKRSRSNHGR